jgi:transcriptional regulator with XRE-family HTH domain
MPKQYNTPANTSRFVEALKMSMREAGYLGEGAAFWGKQTEFAKRCGISKTYLSRTLQEFEIPGMEVLQTMATVCGHDKNYLIHAAGLVPPEVAEAYIKSPHPHLLTQVVLAVSQLDPWKFNMLLSHPLLTAKPEEPPPNGKKDGDTV